MIKIYLSHKLFDPKLIDSIQDDLFTPIENESQSEEEKGKNKKRLKLLQEYFYNGPVFKNKPTYYELKKSILNTYQKRKLELYASLLGNDKSAEERLFKSLSLTDDDKFQHLKEQVDSILQDTFKDEIQSHWGRVKLRKSLYQRAKKASLTSKSKKEDSGKESTSIGRIEAIHHSLSENGIVIPTSMALFPIFGGDSGFYKVLDEVIMKHPSFMKDNRFPLDWIKLLLGQLDSLIAKDFLDSGRIEKGIKEKSSDRGSIKLWAIQEVIKNETGIELDFLGEIKKLLLEKTTHDFGLIIPKIELNKNVAIYPYTQYITDELRHKDFSAEDIAVILGYPDYEGPLRMKMVLFQKKSENLFSDEN